MTLTAILPTTISLTESPRLLYEPLCADHAPGLFESLGDPRVYEHIGDVQSPNVAVLAAQFAYMASGPPPHLAHERWLNYAVKLRTDASLIGRLEATIIEQRAEVAYLFGPRFWGQGYAAEAMAALQDHLRQCEHVTEIWATTTAENTRSIKLLDRFGYVQISDSWPPLVSYASGNLVFALR
jgi:RimJ/RimL family protein N-acetyltransferase